MEPGFQTLVEEFKAVVFDEVELDYQYMSTLTALLPLSANQDSDFNVESKFYDNRKQVVFLKKSFGTPT